ncbi:MAG: hypothetical protein ACKPKO_09775, partial [Candidatus Fonsibacter sp.]
MSNKNDIISKGYYYLSGYGSMNETTKYAKDIDKTNTFKDVKEWFANNVKSKNAPKGTNSFVANGAYQEYQLDLLFTLFANHSFTSLNVIILPISLAY